MTKEQGSNLSTNKDWYLVVAMVKNSVIATLVGGGLENPPLRDKKPH